MLTLVMLSFLVFGISVLPLSTLLRPVTVIEFLFIENVGGGIAQSV